MQAAIAQGIQEQGPRQAVLEASGRSVPAGSINTDEGAHYREAVAGAELPVREQPEPRSNVIPLRRRFASGGRHFR